MSAVVDRLALRATLASHPGYLVNPIALGWAGPTILEGGSDEQVGRWLPGIVDGSDLWCQLFSEPEAGSDLAGVRTRAVRDGDTYLVDGQKIWTTMADEADWGILLARTDADPATPRHRGISYFCVDMSLPGIEVRPITELTGGAHFCEVFLTGVRVDADCRIGAEGEGWRLAGVTLANERESLSEGGVLWGMGPTSEELFDALRDDGGVEPPTLRQEAATTYTEMVALRLLAETGHPSVRKALADGHGQRVTALRHATRGAGGMLGEQRPSTKEDDVWHWGYLFSRALTIGGGTAQVQRNIIGERLLGLPREPR